jgi:hypothetical protein
VVSVNFDPLESNSLALYPNPVVAGAAIHLSLSGGSDAIKEVAIINSLGQVVLTEKTLTDTPTIDLINSTLAAGFYTVKVSTVNGIDYTERLLVR